MTTIGSVPSHSAPPATAPARPPRDAQASAPAADSYTPSTPEAASDYRSVLLERQFGGRYDQLRDLVREFLQRQGVETEGLEQMSQADAQAAIADDGYWGVEQTADRIFQFAVSAAGDDTARLEAVRAAIQKGYDEAKDALGGWLPDISSRTLERVFEKLDEWATAAAEEPEAPAE